MEVEHYLIHWQHCTLQCRVAHVCILELRKVHGCTDAQACDDSVIASPRSCL